MVCTPSPASTSQYSGSIRSAYVAAALSLSETKAPIRDSVAFCDSAAPAISYAASSHAQELRRLALIRAAVAEVEERHWHRSISAGNLPLRELLLRIDDLLEAVVERNRSEQQALLFARLKPIATERAALVSEKERIEQTLLPGSSFTKRSLEQRLLDVAQRLAEIDTYIPPAWLALAQPPDSGDAQRAYERALPAYEAALDFAPFQQQDRERLAKAQREWDALTLERDQIHADLESGSAELDQDQAKRRLSAIRARLSGLRLYLERLQGRIDQIDTAQAEIDAAIEAAQLLAATESTASRATALMELAEGLSLSVEEATELVDDAADQWQVARTSGAIADWQEWLMIFTGESGLEPAEITILRPD